jgi:uncharacterized protein (DUF2235 family)
MPEQQTGAAPAAVHEEPAKKKPVREPRNIVVCCDGTGNQVSGDLSNVLKLFRIVRKDERQRVYYHPGVGTIGESDAWARTREDAKAVFGLATGWGLDDNILDAYRFLCSTWEEGDRIFLFGFSRGAYTVRALAGFIHMIGLLRPEQVNIADYALTAYKKCGRAHEEAQVATVQHWRDAGLPTTPSDSSAETFHEAAADAGALDEKDPFEAARDFSRTLSARRATIHFMGVWDTVASVIVPRRDRFFIGFQLRTLPFTRRNPSVRAFRHAMAADERRRMFRLNRWVEDQVFVANRFAKGVALEKQDCAQRWFAGVHSDIGGGYPEEESSLSKLPLIWMIEEATREEHGLRINIEMFRHLALGEPRRGWTHRYVAPDPLGPMHVSLKGPWKALEWFPKSTRFREWRHGRFGFYQPLGEPRPIAPAEVLHPSVEVRFAAADGPTPPARRIPGLLYPPYRPENLASRRAKLPSQGSAFAGQRALVGLPALLLLAALPVWGIACAWDRAGPFLWSMLVTLLVLVAAALLLLIAGGAVSLIRALSRPKERAPEAAIRPDTP